MKKLPALLMFGALACAPAKDSADSALPAVDTLKAAVATDTVAQRDTAAPAATTKAPATKTSTKTATKKDTTNIGRDRAIQIDTKDPRRRIPTVDTTKRPPQ